MKDEMTAPVRPMLRMLAAAGALLLLIACANLVTLFLERSDSRRAELEVRRALGATRRQLLRQFVVDGAVLSAAGGVGGRRPRLLDGSTRRARRPLGCATRE